MSTPNRWLARMPPRPAPSSPDNRRATGQASERLAAAYLRGQGFDIEAANVRYRFGELDLIASEGHTLCFVEVRSVSSARFGSALDSVIPRKQARIIRASRAYLQGRRPPWSGPLRFDVVAVRWDAAQRPSVTLLRGAFDASPSNSSELPW